MLNSSFFVSPGMSSQNGTTSPECSADSPTFLSPSSNLLFDQHSSEEELEVIMTNPLDALVEISYSNENSDQNKEPKINQHGERLPKRCSSSSTFLEKRKRSLAHNSDDEVGILYLYRIDFVCKFKHMYSVIFRWDNFSSRNHIIITTSQSILEHRHPWKR